MTISVDELVERLNACTIETAGSPLQPGGRYTRKTYRNPDGPEAASQILAMKEALVEARAVAGVVNYVERGLPNLHDDDKLPVPVGRLRSLLAHIDTLLTGD